MHPKPRQCLVLLFTLMHILSLVRSQVTHCTVEQFKQNQTYYDDNFDISNLAKSYPDQRSVRVSCKVGYSGFFKMTCSGDQWTYKGNKCHPRSCGHPGDAQFAEFQLTIGQDFVFGSQVEYTCHKGYLMANRRNSRRCMAQGWDGVIPICEPLQCPAIYPDSNVLVQGDTENAIYRNSVQFSCRFNGQILSGPQEISCNERGEWSATVPKCIEVKCARPNIPNGHVVGGASEYKENDFLHYECDTRYQRLENRLSKCTNLGLRADWSPAPQCEPIKCRLLAEDEATYDPRRNVFFPGETLSIRCGQNYWIGSKQSTSAVTRCQDDGTWTVDPTCRKDFCTSQKPRSVNWWNVRRVQQITLGDRTRFGCWSGYVSTSREAECTRDGWSPDPLCREILCDPVEIDNAVLEGVNRTYRDGQRISYRCKDGYEGNPGRTCQENGWSGSSKCTAKRCPYKGIADARLKQPSRQSYSNGTNLQYVCNKNDDTITVTCVMGKWEGMRECSGCRKAHLENGFVVKRNANTIHFRCNEGYKLSTHISWGVATCRDGHWNGFSGQCIDDTTCGKPPVIPNGRLSDGQHVNQEDSTVEVICEEGFIEQVQNLTCTKGEWSSFGKPLTDICKSDATYCGTPPKIENTVVISSEKLFPPNSVVTYQCHHNFTLEGDGRSVCVNGQWDVENVTCTEIKRAGPNIPNGHGVGDEPIKCRLLAEDEATYDPRRNVFFPGEMLSIRCGQNYWIGSKQRTVEVTWCQDDGTWTLDPTCRKDFCTKQRPSSVSWWDVQQGREVALGQTAQYWCNQGYESATETGVAQCTRVGWRPDPLCREIKRAGPNIPNGHGVGDEPIKCRLQVRADVIYFSPNKNVFSSGETLSIQCGQNYWIGSKQRTSAVTTCQDDGTWTLDPTCRNDFCTKQRPSSVGGWDVQQGREVALGQTAQYWCNRGYERTTETRVAQCTRDGWSPDPLCRAAY